MLGSGFREEESVRVRAGWETEGLTFRKAFFSRVFMMNGGMAARKGDPLNALARVCFSSHCPQQVDKRLMSLLNLFPRQSEAICNNSFKYFRTGGKSVFPFSGILKNNVMLFSSQKAL